MQIYATKLLPASAFKDLISKNLENQKEILAEISKHASGAHEHRRGGTTNSENIWLRNFSRTRRKFSLKFRVMYQAHMSIEEVARHIPIKFRSGISREPEENSRWNFEPCIRSTWASKRWHCKFGKYFIKDYLENQKDIHAEISNHVSGAHEHRKGGTMETENISLRSISRTSRKFSLKFRLMYQEHISIEEVARQIPKIFH